MLYETFTQSRLIGLEAARGHFRQLASFGVMTVASLRAIQAELKGMAMVDKEDFVKVLAKCFQVPEGKQFLLAEAFSLLDVDTKHVLHTSDLLHGLVTLVEGPKYVCYPQRARPVRCMRSRCRGCCTGLTRLRSSLICSCALRQRANR